MKKTVLTFGVISGAIMAVLMFATVPFADRIGFEKLTVVGYTTMIASFLMVFFGIRSYRDNVCGGKISFGRAFKVGILITLISCAFYIVAWQIIYSNLMPDFLVKYQNYLVEDLRASGASQEAIQASVQQMQTFKEWYDNPFIFAALTLLEPLPVGLIITLISAAILRKREKESLAVAASLT